jgi:thioredoxin 1
MSKFILLIVLILSLLSLVLCKSCSSTSVNSISSSINSNSDSSILCNNVIGYNNKKKISISNIKRSIYIKGGSIDDLDGNDDSKVKHANDAATFENILNESNGKLVVVDFSAVWCMPCKMIAPMFDAMANSDEYKDVVFVKIDVDENPEVSEKYQIMSMPTFLFIRDNEVIDRFSGASVEKLKETIDNLQK